MAGMLQLTDGVLSRRGLRRIPPLIYRGLDREWIEEHAEELSELAKDILHGRNATVFEGRVLDPLEGRPKRSVEDLAAQFGVTEKRIYKIEDDCRRRVVEEYRRRTAPKSHGDKCPMCGRVYAEWDFSQCRYTVDNTMRIIKRLSAVQRREHHKYLAPTWNVGWSRTKWPSRLNPDCLPYKYWLELVEMQRRFFGIF
jgi:hypothetical protein